MHPYIREEYLEYEARLKKYWGGGPYFKKMGRMDKINFKESEKK
jgi:hypothetical protein